MRRGEIWIVDLDPVVGREQAGRRPVLVVSPDDFNRANPPIVCPIATAAVGARHAGFTVSLAASGTRVTGVVLCAKVRVLELSARGGRRIEDAPQFVIDEVLACLQDIFEG